MSDRLVPTNTQGPDTADPAPPPAGLGFLFPFGSRGLDLAATDRTRALVESGLRGLSRAQEADGRWAAGLEERRKPACDAGVTGLAALAFLGAGYVPSSDPEAEPHGATLQKALEWLLAQQQSDGGIGDRRTKAIMYNHGFSAQALVEAAGMSGDARIHAGAQRALDFIAAAQNPHWGWRYGVRSGDSDLSITACQWGAVDAAEQVNRAASEAGVAPPFVIGPDVAPGVRKFLYKMQEEEYGRFGYQQRGDGAVRDPSLHERFPGHKSVAIDGAGLWCSLGTGADPKSSGVRKSVQLIMKYGLPVWEPYAGAIDYLSWFYGAHATERFGGDAAIKWRAAVDHALTAGAERNGDAIAWPTKDPWSTWGGPSYASALAILTLEARWREAKGQAVRRSVEALVGRQGAPNARRVAAMSSLGQRPTRWTPGVLAKALNQREPILVRLAAARVLGVLGPKAKVMAGTMRKALAAEADPSVVEALRDALVKVEAE